MKLSDMTNVAMYNVVNDGEFLALGLLSHKKPKLLVCFYDPNYLPQLSGNTNIACVIAKPDLADNLPPGLGIAISDDPLKSFYQIHCYLFSQTEFYWQSSETVIGSSATISERSYIPRRNVTIGERVIIEPNVVINEHSFIGDDVIIRSGAVIGGEGFEPKYIGGKHVVVPHAGGVRIGSRVEIQSNTHIARSVYNGCTEIGDDTKFDALVHVAHNVQIGASCEIAAGAIISGSATIGNFVWIGPGAVISSEVAIGDHAFIALGSVVTKDVPDHARMWGVPAKPLPKKPGGES